MLVLRQTRGRYRSPAPVRAGAVQEAAGARWASRVDFVLSSVVFTALSVGEPGTGAAGLLPPCVSPHGSPSHLPFAGPSRRCNSTGPEPAGTANGAWRASMGLSRRIQDDRPPQAPAW